MKKELVKHYDNLYKEDENLISIPINYGKNEINKYIEYYRKQGKIIEVNYCLNEILIYL